MFHSATRLCLALAALLGACALATACDRGNHVDSPLDLIHLIPEAQKRSALPLERAISVRDADVGGDVRPSVRTCGAARISWALRLPDRPVLRTAIAVDRTGSAGVGPITFRIGMAERQYDLLFRQQFQPADELDAGRPRWHAVSINLAAYSGWQWSYFYRPWEITWHVMFSLDTAVSPDGRTECGYWAMPRIQSGG